MSTEYVKHPRGTLIKGDNGTVELKWNTNFQPKHERKFKNAQKIIDSEVLRVTEPYIPLVTGTLIKSGILGSVIGSGWVEWIVPYAHRIYYSKSPVGRPTGPLRGPLWFDRAMVDHKQEIIKRAGAAFGR